MPITVTCPNPACGQVCSVQDQYAGMQVSCPKCSTVFAVPQSAPPAVASVSAPPPEPTTAPAPIAPGISPPAPSPLLQNANQMTGGGIATILLWVGLGCLAGMALFTFLPWVGGFGAGALGIRMGPGVVNLLLSLGLATLLFVAVLRGKKELFDDSVLCATVWAIVASLERFFNIAVDFQGASGFGVYLVFFVSIGAAGTFGFLCIPRLIKKL